MPELPELEVIRERLHAAIAGARLSEARLHDPFVLRSVEPPWETLVGRRVLSVSRRAKFLLLELGSVTDSSTAPAGASPRPPGPTGVELAIHLMLGGRLHLRDPATFKPHRRRTLGSLRFDFDEASATPSSPETLLEMTEAGTKRRASLRVLGPGSDRTKLERGVEPLDASLDAAAFAAALRRRNQHVARALRDPEVVAGVGNAYADEILFAARLSPVRLTARLEDAEIARLLDTMRRVLTEWTDRVRAACPQGLPARQSDWRRDMAVHGRAGQPCPACGGRIARIARKDAETNYCPTCQNEGRLLADRRLSRFGIRRA